MRFVHPEALWLLLLCPLLGLIVLLSLRRHAALWRRLGDPALLQHTLPRFPRLHRPWVRVLLLLLPVLSIVVALAEPRVSSGEIHVRAGSLDTVMVVDVSTSMSAEDVSQRSRLAVARDTARHLLAELRGNRVGIVTFAGTSSRQAELTEDLSVLDFIVQHWIKEGAAGVAGSNLAQAIATGMALFPENDTRRKLLVLFSDGGHTGEALEPILDQAVRQKIKMITLGLGGTQPSRIPQYDEQHRFTGYMQVDGDVITTRLHAAPLQRIAATTGGTYRHVQHRGGGRNLLTPDTVTGDVLTRGEQPLFQLFLLLGLLAFGVHTLAARL